MSRDRDRRALAVRWLLAALIGCAVSNALIIVALMKRGESFERAFQASGLWLTRQIRGPIDVDSWRPMAQAYLHEREFPGDLYWVFLVKHIKFQYPPSSLLALKLWPLPVVFPIPPALRAALTLPSLLAVLATIACSALVLLKLTSKPPRLHVPWRNPYVLLIVGLVGVLGVTYYPLTKGHNLGQIQVYLGALAAAALLFHTIGLRELSGACLGLCCLVKPQYGIVLLWGLLRRQPRFVLGFVVVAGAGFAWSLHEFGLANHLQYLEVLKALSRYGEAFGPNQSVNGLLQRWFENGSAIVFQKRGLPPYHPIVYYATLVSSLVIVALALFLPSAAASRGRTLDLAVVLCAATMASPIAWEHHYGAFLPVFAAAIPAAIEIGRGTFWLLLLSYTLMANELTIRELVFADRWVGLLGSHIFFGAVLLFGILLAARLRGTGDAPLRG